MATNYIQDGKRPTFTAPAGGVKSGSAYAIGDLVVVAIHDAAAGEHFAGATDGVWELPTATGLSVGAAVGLKAGQVVAAATEGAIKCGFLLTAPVSGTAQVLLK